VVKNYAMGILIVVSCIIFCLWRWHDCE